MIIELNRLIEWVENYGLPKEEILQMLNKLTVEERPPVLTGGAERLEERLRRSVPNPADRAKLFSQFLLVSPEEEPEPEETVEHMQFMTLFLRAVREIVETADSRAKALEAIDAVLYGS